MGHRDIWGKDSRKWKKMCPCFDAEAEYAFLDDVKLDKYEDAGVTIEEELTSLPIADRTIKHAPQYETYVLDHPRDYTGLFNKIAPAPWTN